MPQGCGYDSYLQHPLGGPDICICSAPGPRYGRWAPTGRTMVRVSIQRAAQASGTSPQRAVMSWFTELIQIVRSYRRNRHPRGCKRRIAKPVDAAHEFWLADVPLFLRSPAHADARLMMPTQVVPCPRRVLRQGELFPLFHGLLQYDVHSTSLPYPRAWPVLLGRRWQTTAMQRQTKMRDAG